MEKKRKKNKTKQKEHYIQFDERVENRIETGISGILSPQFTLAEWANEMARNRHNAIRPNPIIHGAILLVKRFHAAEYAYLALIVGSRSLANTCAHSVKIHGYAWILHLEISTLIQRESGGDIFFFFAQVSFIIREKKRKRCNTVRELRKSIFFFFFSQI